MIDLATHKKQQATLCACKRCGWLTYDEEANCEKCRNLDQIGGGAGFSF